MVYLKPGEKFKIDDSCYEILKGFTNDKIQVLDIKYGDFKYFTRDELIQFLHNGQLKFEVKGRNIKKDIHYPINTEYVINDIENEKHKELSRFRYNVIKPLLEIPYSYRRIFHIEERVKEINNMADNPTKAMEILKCQYFKPVSVTSVYRWLNYYEESGGDFVLCYLLIINVVEKISTESMEYYMI